jgi:hypothetical protein
MLCRWIDDDDIQCFVGHIFARLGENMTHIGLTQLARSACGSVVLHFYLCAVFPRYARKNRTQKDA